MKAVIIDDEKEQRELHKMILETYCPAIQVVGEANGVAAGVTLINKLAPDLVLLDIEMGDGTGFDLLKKLIPIEFKVIFVTAHHEFAVKAFKFSALDYLLKPIDPEELQLAVQKALSLHSQDKMKLQLSVLLSNIQDFAGEVKKLILKDSENIHLVSIGEIVRLESEKNYTTFFLTENRKILISKTLKEYEQILEDKGFFRCHQSHLVNLNYLVKIDKRDGGSLLMKDGVLLPLATRRKEELMRILENM
jgi:two-component system, LytTR family, response regulator